MDADDHVCLCFRVSRRKLEKYVRLHAPAVPSLLSECGGAGTGCGWCIPFLKKIWEQGTAEDISSEEYAAGRAAHIAAGKGTPPKDIQQGETENTRENR